MALFIVSPLLGGPRLSLGSIPSARSLADISLLPNTVLAAPLLSSSTLAPMAPVVPSLPMPNQVSQPLLLSPSFSPLPPKLVDRIRKGEFVEMRELLTDNISLLRHLEELQPGMSSLQHATGSSRPRLREVSSILTWTYCFLTYCAVRTDDVSLRGLLTYARLLLREARRHGGSGWIEYDRIFRQQVAADPTIPWNALNASLVASTFLGSRSEQGMFCNLCQEVDHPKECALQSVRGNTPLSSQGPSQPSFRQSPSHKIRPETLERICTS